MTALVNGGLDSPADGTQNGASRHFEEPGGSFRQPPPPPPPPAKPGLAKQAKRVAGGFADSIAAQPGRYKVIGGIAVLVAVNVVATRMFMPAPPNEQAIADYATSAAVDTVRAELNLAKNSQTQIAVPTPFSWVRGCQLTNEAKQMIGGDPDTGGRTVNIERATPLEQQASALLTSFRIVDLRLVAPTLGTLRVVADDSSAGVRLFNCEFDGMEPAPNVVETPQDPTPTSVAAG